LKGPQLSVSVDIIFHQILDFLGLFPLYSV